ncbi:MAG: glycosyltransferase [Vicingaceae bacterium]
MKKLLYVYQNYRRSYSSASLSILRGLEKLENLEVSSFEFKPISYINNVNRVLNRLPLIKTLHFKRQNRFLEKEVQKGGYDYVFVMKGTNLKSDTLVRLKNDNPSTTFICFNPDDPFNSGSSNQDILDSIKFYDYYCIWTHLLGEKLKAAGAEKVLYFPFGVDEEIIYPLEAAYQYDISFIGNGDEERHNIIRSLAEELKRRGHEMKVHVFGNNWPAFGENVLVHGQRNGKEMLKTIAASKINLNLLRKQNKNSINMRTFEIPAAKGFMLHEQSMEAELFFNPSEVAYFDSINRLADQCEYYLKQEELREEIVEKALQKVNKSEFSYEKIVRECLKRVL